MTGKAGLALAGTHVERKRGRRIKAVPTLNSLDKSFRDYCVGDLTKSQEQSKTDSNSFIFVPNRIRSDGKNDYHSRQNESDLNLVARLAASLIAHTLC